MWLELFERLPDTLLCHASYWYTPVILVFPIRFFDASQKSSSQNWSKFTVEVCCWYIIWFWKASVLPYSTGTEYNIFHGHWQYWVCSIIFWFYEGLDCWNAVSYITVSIQQWMFLFFWLKKIWIAVYTITFSYYSTKCLNK